MPNPNILFQNQPGPSLSENFESALGTQQKLNEFRNQPLKNRLLQNDVAASDMGLQQAQKQIGLQEQDQQRKQYLQQIGDMAVDAVGLLPLIEAGDVGQITTALDKRIEKIKARGGDPSDTMDFRDRLLSGQINKDQAVQELNSVVSTAERIGAIRPDSQMNMPTAEQKNRATLIKAIRPALDANGNFDPSKANAEQRSAAMDLGLIPKSGTMTMGEREAYDPSLASTITDIEADRAGQVEESKTRNQLMAELDLKPSVQAAVETAVQTAKQSASRKDEKRSNAKAFATYESAMSGLFNALGETATGPIVGFAPALTANQQIADGAVAAMAPVLKEIFRVSGEGTFTDKDQELLLRMLPTRKTLPEARANQTATVDAIVRSKLGQPVNVVSPVLGREVTMGEIFDEAVANGMTIEEVKAELGIE